MKCAEEHSRGRGLATLLAGCLGAMGVGAMGLEACTGQIQGGAGAGFSPPATGATGGPASTGGAPGAGGNGGSPAITSNGWPSFTATTSFGLRRLTTEQYLKTVQTLLGVATMGMPAIEKVSPAGGFSAMGASTAAVSSAGVGAFEDAARFLAHAAFDPNGPRAKLVPCTPVGPADTACFSQCVSVLGQRAFRRPLSTDEIARYAAVAVQVAMAADDAWQGLEAITSAFLQSPHFLYLSEVGAPDPQDPTRNRYTSYEMASRLSYFLTNDMPDDTLFAAAASGALATPEGVQEQAVRLLATPAAHGAVRAFFETLLSLENLDALVRPTELFPKFTPTLGAAMRQETALVIDDLVFGRNGDYRSLFNQQETFVNAELAALYGVAAPASGGFERVTLPPGSHRAGLLGQAGVLAARDHGDGTSPTRRGLFVLTRLLCQNLPLAPPANLAIPPPPTGLLTARDKLEQHASNSVCASCHRVTDPVGLSLEHFDAMGVYREDDHGLRINDQGTLGDKMYQGAVGLGEALREHPALGPCLLQSLYGVGVGHLATEYDRAPFGALVQSWDASGARVREALLSVVTSDGFRTAPPPMTKGP